VGRDLPGTTAYKLALRNEIRGFIHYKGVPTLFLTLSPSDIDHPLVRLLSGHEVSIEDHLVGEELSSWRRALNVAQHPAAAALFFDVMITHFIKVILRYGRPGAGLFGKCTGYYATVEAQGRGTLHCHMLIWLAGHLGPQRLRQRLLEDPAYKERLFLWLESIIKCELPGTTQVVLEHSGALQQPRLLPGMRHPGTYCPQISSLSDSDYIEALNTSVRELVERYNWHVHRSCCWQYLRRNEPHDDAHCRMHIDGSTCAVTSLDDETLSVLLRRLHPRINNYNDLVIFLLKCNMDIKFVGSGEAAKALVYYVTDYITKASLPTHAGLLALAYAIKRTNEHYSDGPMQPGIAEKSKTALVKVVNAMMSKQEVSHQQVMSYLVGGGDHYSSHKFAILYWAGFDNLVRRHFDESRGPGDRLEGRDRSVVTDVSEMMLGSQDVEGLGSQFCKVADVLDVRGAGLIDDIRGDFEGTALEDDSGEFELESDVMSDVESDGGSDDDKDRYSSQMQLHVERGRLSVSSQEKDWMFRGSSGFFGCCCLYEFVMWACKISKASERTRLSRVDQRNGGGGRIAEERAVFDSDHPQAETHLLRKYCERRVPVILGPSIPRCDRGEDEYEAWCRAMVILFKPWWRVDDLKVVGQTWREAYEEYRDRFPAWACRIMGNMNVLNECKDARDSFRAKRHRQHDFRPVLGVESDTADFEGFSRDVMADPELNETLDDYGEDDGVAGVLQRDETDEVIGCEVRKLWDELEAHGDITLEGGMCDGDMVTAVNEGDVLGLSSQMEYMETLKRKRRPGEVSSYEESFQTATTSRTTCYCEREEAVGHART